MAQLNNQVIARENSWWQRLTRSAASKVLEFTGTQRYLNIQLDITNSCNLRCIHCYHPHHQNAGALGFEQWKLIFDQYGALLRKLRLLPSVTLCGGEPMTSSLLGPMLREIQERWAGTPTCILTNGTVLRSDILPVLRQVGVDFQVSLDGPDAARHDEIRGKGNFERTLKGIRLYAELGLDVHLLAVLSRKTAAWIPDFFKLASSLPGKSMNFTRFIPEGFGEKLLESESDRPLGPWELKVAYEEILSHSRQSGIATDTSQPLFHLVDSRLGGHGMLGYQGLIIDYQGRLKLSSRGNFVLGNVLEEGLESLFLEHSLMRALRNGNVEQCGDCEFSRVCGGYRTAAYASTGSFLAPDPACWYLGEQQQTRRKA